MFHFDIHEGEIAMDVDTSLLPSWSGSKESDDRSLGDSKTMIVPKGLVVLEVGIEGLVGGSWQVHNVGVMGEHSHHKLALGGDHRFLLYLV